MADDDDEEDEPIVKSDAEVHYESEFSTVRFALVFRRFDESFHSYVVAASCSCVHLKAKEEDEVWQVPSTFSQIIGPVLLQLAISFFEVSILKGAVSLQLRFGSEGFTKWGKAYLLADHLYVLSETLFQRLVHLYHFTETLFFLSYVIFTLRPSDHAR